MVIRCIVSGCLTTSKYPTHKFPKDSAMFTKWKNAIESAETMNLTDEKLKKCVVCHLHFKPDDYCVDFKRRTLKPCTIPSVNLPRKDHLQNDICIAVPNKQTEDIVVTESCHASFLLGASTNEVIQPSMDVDTSLGLNNSQTAVSQNIVKSSRKRIRLPKIRTTDFNPETRKLYATVNILRREQKKMQRKLLSYRQRLRLAENFNKTTQFQKMCDNMNPIQKRFIEMQLRLSKFSSKVNENEYFILH